MSRCFGNSVGGLGMSKHRTMGHSGPNGHNKLLTAKLVNELQTKRSKRQRMHASIRDLMKDR